MAKLVLKEQKEMTRVFHKEQEEYGKNSDKGAGRLLQE